MSVAFVVVLVINILSNNVYCQAERYETYPGLVPNSFQRNIDVGPCRFVTDSQCPDPDIRFFMYSGTYRKDPDEIYVGTHLQDTNLRNTSFDPSKPSKVIIHGYKSSAFLGSVPKLTKAYLKKDYNIFLVDWSPLNKFPCYPAAMLSIGHVGNCTAQLINRIRDMGAVNIHVIGFSLGAGILNYVGLALRPYKLPRMTGLDPALFGFITEDINEKLDKSDADFVDVYHTNAWLSGKVETCGHVDFYFNGGSFQPGCWNTEEYFLQCCHNRAVEYFAETINSDEKFWAKSCSSYWDILHNNCSSNESRILLGENINKTIFGIFMIKTNSSPPYAVNASDQSITSRCHEEIDQNSVTKVYKMFDQVLEKIIHNSMVQPNVSIGELEMQFVKLASDYV